MNSPLHALLAAERHHQRGRLLLAGLSAAVTAATSVLLLGLSGWFITGAALAGAGGVTAVASFNYLLPSAGIRLLAVLRTLCRYSERVSGHNAALRALARIRPALYRALATAPVAEAMALSVGDATARAVQDVDEIEAHFVRRSSLWGAAASCGTGSVLLMVIGGTAMTGVAVIFLGMVIASRRLAVTLEACGREVPEANGRLKQQFAALAAATPELHAYGLEAWAAARIADRAQTLVAAQQRVTAASGWFELLLAAATGLAAMLALAIAHAAPLPIAALAALGAAMTIDGAGAYVRGLQRQGQLRAAEARLDAMLCAAPAPISSYSIPDSPGIELADRSVVLRPGTIAGITGPSGWGKTSFIEHLLQLKNTGRGRIRLGGVEINDLDPASVRRCFAVAPQDAALLAGTVRQNLALADADATDADILDALHDAALDERVRGLPGGLACWLGENGVRLSGGERRRLALARAYLRPAPWLLLDEPTEGLDSRTEAVVVQRLWARLAHRRQGAVLVSHRAAPLAICDVVLAFGDDRSHVSVSSKGETVST
jgi:ATP-binding cassette subfamily C protein CydC